VAVFPDRIVLKNSSDEPTAIEAAIAPGGTDAITQGELVLAIKGGEARIYTLDDTGNVISIASNAIGGRAIVDTDPPTTGLGGPLAGGDLWFEPDTDRFYVYYSANWVQISGGSGGGGASKIDDLTDVDTSTTPPVLFDILAWNGSNWVPVEQQQLPTLLEGSLVVGGDGEAVELPIGADGQVLAIDSGEVVWKDVSGTGTVTSVGITPKGPITVANSPITAAGAIEVGMEEIIPSGTYTNPNISVDTYGRVTSIEDGVPGALSIDELTDVDTSTVPPSDGQILAWNDAEAEWQPTSVSGTGSVTSVDLTAGEGLTATGGPITAAGTFNIDLDDTGITAGTYGYATITVDEKGRITAATDNPDPLFDRLVNEGDMFIRYNGVTTRLGIGSQGQGLTVNNGIPTWTDLSTGGTVTSIGITAGTGIVSSGGPVTNSGDIFVALENTGVIAGSYSSADVVVDSTGRITSITNGSGGGTVTSVGITAGTGIEVANSPVTSSGNIDVGLANTAVTPGTYIGANITVDAKGRIIAAENGPSSGAASINSLTDVDTETTPPTDGQTLLWNDIAGEWRPGAPPVGLNEVADDPTPTLGGNLDVYGYYITNSAATAINIESPTGEVIIRGGSSDGRITLNCTQNSHGVTLKAPPHSAAAEYTLVLPETEGGARQVLSNDGTGNLYWSDQLAAKDYEETTGTLAEFPLAGIDGFYADQAALEADGFTYISNSANRDDAAIVFTPPSHFNGVDYLGIGIQSGGQWFINSNGGVGWDLENNTTTSRTGIVSNVASDIDFYVSWTSQDTETRIAGYKEHTAEGKDWLVVRVDMKIPYGSDTNGMPLEAWFATDGSISVRYGAGVGGASIATGGERCVISSNGVYESPVPYSNMDFSGNYAYNRLLTVSELALNDLTDVQAPSPSAGEVLAWNGTAWAPAAGGSGDGVTSIIAGSGISVDQSTGDVTISATGGGGGGSGAGIYLTEVQTASSGTADFTGLGYSGILQKVTSSLDAWVVLYSSAADRTADAGRAYNEDPTPGSGVLFEAYITAGGTVVATPGTTYMNSDAALTEAVYAAVRDQSGAAVNAAVTINAYGLAAITAVSGGTFGSGL